MYLEQLVLEGFLSYREKQIIDFTDVASCLVLGQIEGDSELSNGAGKSSLFESVPVCFFSKGSGRSDVLDSYINDKMKKMFIGVTFRIDNQRFKTERTKTRASTSLFEIFMDTTNTELENATWKKTDKSIEDILGLSSKTYSSTIYLNEREALKIITGTSSDRKEILRELLDIEIYEKAAKASSKKFDEFERKMLVNLDMIKDRKLQLEEEEPVKIKLEETQKALNENKLINEKTNLDLKAKNESRLALEIDLKTQKVISSQIEQKQKELDETNKKKTKIVNDTKELNEEVIEQSEKFKQYKLKIEKQAEQKPQIALDLTKIDAKLKIVDEAEEQIKTLNEELKTSNEQIKQHNEEIKVHNEEVKLQEKQKQKLLSSIEVSKAEKKPINELLSRLDDFESVCPVTSLECTVLNKEYKTTMFGQKKLELSAIDEKVKEIEKDVKKVGENIEKIEEKITIIEDKIKVIEKQQYVLTSKENDLKKITKTRQEINDSLTQLKLKSQSIENDENNLKQKSIEFAQYLEQSKKEIEEFNETLKTIEVSTIDIQNSKKELESTLNKEIQTKVDNLNLEIRTIERMLSTIAKEIENKNQELGEIKNSLARLEKMKLEIQHMSKNNEENTKQKKIFQKLSEIFGKDGMQKTLMKEAIPLLEKYTLDFLKIFNEDSEKIKVKFDLDPKRQDGEYKKGGGLDILVIEEEKDPKDLQMYSGGETVRITFSIVLALAKLLSLRAGKRHESLIIDEKIAKLDARGIEQFGEVIKEIAKIYKQVFIITHIDTLKDMINGNLLIVNKTENEGSLVTLN